MAADVAMESPSTGAEREKDREVKPKRSRASKPKVKTGCQTCKIRRVKCDETKPNCMRCVKFGHQCDGYGSKSPSKPASSGASSRTLIPKATTPTTSPTSPTSSTTTTPTLENILSPFEPTSPNPQNKTASTYTFTNSNSPYSPTSPISLLPRSPSRSLFASDHELDSFSNFCTSTAHQLSGTFDSDLWTRLMLQACETSPPIRHAIIALGSLPLSPPSSPSSRPSSPHAVGTLRHQFAYRQYSKAVHLMRRDVAGGKHELRTTLIACLLFYCFESFSGYHSLAISQIYSGLRMIRDWCSSFYTPDPVSGRVSGKIKIGSENRYIVEDDILRAFGGLEIQVMSYADGRNADVHEHYRRCGQASIDEMFARGSFADLNEARNMLELVIRRSMHWLRSTMHLHDFSTGRKAAGRDSESGSLSADADGEGPMGLFFDVDPTYGDQIATLKEYTRWDSAFQPLWRMARDGRGLYYAEYLLASTLRLHWLAGYMSIASNNCTHSLHNGRFTRELEELVAIARILLDENGKEGGRVTGGLSAGFAFDVQIIVPLMTVGWVYRHRALRREAISLLLRSPRKEGVWDGIVVGRIMAWLAGVEEEGLGDAMEDEGHEMEYVPEWAAARCIKMSFDTGRREACVSCLQPVRGSVIGEERRREVIIPW